MCNNFLGIIINFQSWAHWGPNCGNTIKVDGNCGPYSHHNLFNNPKSKLLMNKAFSGRICSHFLLLPNEVNFWRVCLTFTRVRRGFNEDMKLDKTIEHLGRNLQPSIIFQENKYRRASGWTWALRATSLKETEGDQKAERLNGQAMLSFSVPTYNDFELSCSCRIIQVLNKHFAMYRIPTSLVCINSVLT